MEYFWIFANSEARSKRTPKLLTRHCREAGNSPTAFRAKLESAISRPDESAVEKSKSPPISVCIEMDGRMTISSA